MGRRRQRPHRRFSCAPTTTSWRVSAAATTRAIRSSSASRKIALRIVPSGVLQANAALFIGGGTVVSLAGLLAEFDMLEKIGVDVSRIKISDRAHIVFPYHGDARSCKRNGTRRDAIGTTGRGIGPAYTDKVSRIGIIFGDLHHREALASKIRAAFWLMVRELAAMETSPREEDLIAETLAAVPRILPHVVDGVSYSTMRSRAANGFSWRGRKALVRYRIRHVSVRDEFFDDRWERLYGPGHRTDAHRSRRGIAKAYATRVGAGPFPSELARRRRGTSASQRRRVRNRDGPFASLRLV